MGQKEIFDQRRRQKNAWRETFFTEVTGNKASDHYLRNIYIKVFLRIAVPWILVILKIFINKLVYSFENTCNKCGVGLINRKLISSNFIF